MARGSPSGQWRPPGDSQTGGDFSGNQSGYPHSRATRAPVTTTFSDPTALQPSWQHSPKCSPNRALLRFFRAYGQRIRGFAHESPTHRDSPHKLFEQIRRVRSSGPRLCRGVRAWRVPHRCAPSRLPGIVLGVCRVLRRAFLRPISKSVGHQGRQIQARSSTMSIASVTLVIPSSRARIPIALRIKSPYRAMPTGASVPMAKGHANRKDNYTWTQALASSTRRPMLGLPSARRA